MAMQTDVRPFIQTGNTVSLLCTGVSSTTTIANPRSLVAQMPGTFRVYNTGPSVGWVVQGNVSTITASSTIPSNSVPIAAGNTETMALNADTGWIAGVCGSSLTCTMYLTPGQGI